MWTLICDDKSFTHVVTATTVMLQHYNIIILYILYYVQLTKNDHPDYNASTS